LHVHITAERLIRHLERIGSVLMRSEPNGVQPGAKNGHLAVIAMLIAGTFEYADFAVPLPDLDFVSSGLTLRGGNGAFVGDAVNVSRVGNSIAVIKEIQTIMCHTPSVFLWPRGSTKPAEAI
jgi:hypothetical protein